MMSPLLVVDIKGNVFGRTMLYIPIVIAIALIVAELLTTDGPPPPRFSFSHETKKEKTILIGFLFSTFYKQTYSCYL